MNRLYALLSALALLGTISSPGVFAQDPKFKQLDSVVIAELKAINAPGAAIAIVKGDSVIYRRGYGVANIETGDSVTPDMLFRIGSVTKMYTNAALVLLAARGGLDLHAPISRYLPWLPSKLGRVTTHQLMSHTSGMADTGVMYGSQDEAGLAAGVRQLTDSLIFAKPGAVFSYSNAGIALAGYIAEHLYGIRYAAVIDSVLLAPLGMRHTTFQPTVAMTYRLAQGHAALNDKLILTRPAENNTAIWPAGFLFSNVDDLSRFAIAYLNDGVLRGKRVLPSSIREIGAPQVTVPSYAGPISHGYGLFAAVRNGVNTVEHNGGTHGYGSLFLMVPEHKVAIIALVNRGNAQLARSIDKALELAIPRSQHVRKEPTVMVVATDTTLLGTYMQPGEEAKMTIARSPGGLVLQLTGEMLGPTSGMKLPLKSAGRDLLAARFPGTMTHTRLAIVRDRRGKVKYLHLGLRAFPKVE